MRKLLGAIKNFGSAYDDSAFEREEMAFVGLGTQLNELNATTSAYLATLRQANDAAQRVALCFSTFVSAGGESGGAVDTPLASVSKGFHGVHAKLTPALLIQRIEEKKGELVFALEKIGRVRRDIKGRHALVHSYVKQLEKYDKAVHKLKAEKKAEKKAELEEKVSEKKALLLYAGEALEQSTSELMHEMVDIQAQRPALVRELFETLLQCQHKYAADTHSRLTPLLAAVPSEGAVAQSVRAVKHVHDAEIKLAVAASARVPQFGVPLSRVRHAGDEELMAPTAPLVLVRCADFIATHGIETEVRSFEFVRSTVRANARDADDVCTSASLTPLAPAPFSIHPT